jgi:hypothetical protein
MRRPIPSMMSTRVIHLIKLNINSLQIKGNLSPPKVVTLLLRQTKKMKKTRMDNITWIHKEVDQENRVFRND